MTDFASRPYRPAPEFCCSRCVFGEGEHSEFCAVEKYHGRRPPTGVRIVACSCPKCLKDREVERLTA